MKTERFDIHQNITDQIIAALERGAGEFRLPWHRSAGNIMRPVNIASKKAYRGVNILTLWATADEKGYTAGAWGTYRQWAETGAPKGREGRLYRFLPGDLRRFRRHQRGRYPPARRRSLPPNRGIARRPLPSKRRRQSHADQAGRGLRRGDRCDHQSRRHSRILPLPELTHWTRLKTRCNRQLGKRFGDDPYAMEELIAELCPAFLCAHLRIIGKPRADHAQYLDH